MTIDPERSAALTEQFERELIKRAQQGDAEAGREILYAIALSIDHGRFDSPLFPFLADCLLLFARDNVPLEQALCVESKKGKGGRPPKYDSTELMAVDILLQEYGAFSPEQAVEWIEDNIGADRRTVQRLRPAYQPMKSRDRGLLLHLAGNLRSKVAQALTRQNAD